MAKIVLAMATTHGPQLHTTVEQWALRVKADMARKHPFRRRMYGFDELVEMRGTRGSRRSPRMRRWLDRIGAARPAWRRSPTSGSEIKPDVAVILGNDQNEMFETDELNPAFIVFCGETIPNYLQSEERRKELPPGVAEAEHGHATEEYTEYAASPI